MGCMAFTQMDVSGFVCWGQLAIARVSKFFCKQNYWKGGSSPFGGQVTNVTSSDDYKKCIDAAIRFQESQFLVNSNGDQQGEYVGHEFCTAGVRRCFDCRSPARYGTDRTTLRFNKILSACQLDNLMVRAGIMVETGNTKHLEDCSH
jgi:hypothetical protein